jgi:hypothetical protein
MADVAASLPSLSKPGRILTLVGRVAAAFAEREAIPVLVRDEAAERRRQKDRDRKQLLCGNPRKSADSAETSPLDDKCPQTPKNTKPPSKNPPKGGQKGSQKGTRLPDGWLPSESLRRYAEERGITGGWLVREIERFDNFWRGKSGKDATKVDWDATWRNWCLSAADRGPPKGVTLVSPTLEHGSEVAGQVFVHQDTPQWDAWTKYRGRPPPTDRRGGWFLPSEWPPELELSGCNQSEKPEEGLRH